MNKLFFLVILIIFCVLSNLNFDFYGEYSLIEISQNCILLTSLFIHLKNRKLFLKLSNYFTFIMRGLFLIFILIEEISFLTKSQSNLIRNINYNSEINLHNLSILNTVLFDFKLPFINQFFSIALEFFLYSLILFIIGFGLYIPKLKKLRYLYLEKEYAIFTCIYIGNIIFSSFIRRYFEPSTSLILRGEFLELFIYLIFLSDIVIKNKKMKFTLNNSRR